MLRAILLLLAVCWSVPTLAAEPEVSGFKLERTKAGDRVTLRLKLDQMLDFRAFTLEGPNRVVVDLAGAVWKVEKSNASDEQIAFVKKLRAGRPIPETLRVVLDVSKPVTILDSFIQVPSRKADSHYLIVKIALKTEEEKEKPEAKPEPEKVVPEPKTAKESKKNFAKAQAAKKEENKPVEEKPVVVAEAPPPPRAFIPVPKFKPERYTIVIDPGHGGVDPGAIGAQGTKEKNITLRYAKHLRDLLDSSRYEVVMTRADDAYVPLRGRVKKAQAAKGHLFISLHADSHPEETMHGLSVYTLSETASDKEAEALAERENKKDIITGVDLSNQSKDVAEVLIDLAQRDTKNTSARFAELVVAELGTEAKLLKNTHRFAGFAVLKGVGIPSALVELGYLSNPKEEAQLISAAYEDKLVRAIARAVDTYCDQYAPKDTTP